VGEARRYRIAQGIGRWSQRIAAFSQINGNDTEHEEWYDLLGSAKAAPIFNSEDHALEGRDSAAMVREVLWQGALHGRNAATIWVWERTVDNLLHRPDMVAAIGRTALDLNRLAPEVTALHAAPAAVAVFHSPLSSWNRYSDAAYSALQASGLRVDFIWDTPAAAAQFQRYRLVVIPGDTPMSAAALEGLTHFIDAGGTVITFGDRVLLWDDHGQRLPRALRLHILSKTTTLGTAFLYGGLRDTLRDTLRQSLTRLGLTRVQVVDATTQRPVSGVEWRAVQTKGRWLLSIVSDTTVAQTLSVRIDSQPMERAQELISATPVQGPTIQVAPWTPYLFAFSATGPSTSPNHLNNAHPLALSPTSINF